MSYHDEVFPAEWFTCVNDEIGGYEIRTEPGPSSMNQGVSVADFITEEVADHVVRLHNEWLDRVES